VIVSSTYCAVVSYLHNKEGEVVEEMEKDILEIEEKIDKL
jgi:hypothetical protein